MYSDINARIENVRRQIKDVSYSMIEAEDEEHEELSEQLEQLENELAELKEMQGDLKQAMEMSYNDDY